MFLFSFCFYKNVLFKIFNAKFKVAIQKLQENMQHRNICGRRQQTEHVQGAGVPADLVRRGFCPLDNTL